MPGKRVGGKVNPGRKSVSGVGRRRPAAFVGGCVLREVDVEVD